MSLKVQVKELKEEVKELMQKYEALKKKYLKVADPVPGEFSSDEEDEESIGSSESESLSDEEEV